MSGTIQIIETALLYAASYSSTSSAQESIADSSFAQVSVDDVVENMTTKGTLERGYFDFYIRSNAFSIDAFVAEAKLILEKHAGSSGDVYSLTGSIQFKEDPLAITFSISDGGYNANDGKYHGLDMEPDTGVVGLQAGNFNPSFRLPKGFSKFIYRILAYTFHIPK